MTLNFEYFETDGTAVAAGVFIPISDLIGISAGEFADSQSVATKDAKLAYSLANIFTNGDLASALGLSAIANNIAGQSAVLSSKSYSFTVQYYADQESDVVDVLPLPIIGNQVGVGEVAFEDLFPNSVKVAASGATVGEGVLIPTSLVNDFGAPLQASLNLANDCRSYIGALIRYMISVIPVRSASVASAITAKALNPTTGVTLPAIATDATNPTTSINSADLPKLDFFSKTMTFTIQRIENESTQSYDVNVATA